MIYTIVLQTLLIQDCFLLWHAADAYILKGQCRVIYYYINLNLKKIENVSMWLSNWILNYQ